MDAPESTSSDQLYPLLTPGNGLVVSRSESEEGEISYVIKEPVSERFVSLGEIEYFIFQQIDGKTPFEIIQFRVQKTFGAELSINQLNSFLNSLWKRGFLLIEGDESTHQAKKKGRFGGNILYLRFKAFNPDRLFDFLINKIRFLFTPGFVIFSTIVILMGFITLFMNTAELAYDSARLFQIKTLFIMWLIILPVTILHEFAHGLTCKNFGGKVSEIGFMFMFFQPAMY